MNSQPGLPALAASDILALPVGAEVTVVVDGQPPIRAQVQDKDGDTLTFIPIPQPVSPTADHYYWLGPKRTTT